MRIDKVALQRHDITVETMDLSEVFSRMAAIKESDPAYAAMQAAIERRRMRLSNESWLARWNRESGWTELTAEDAARMTRVVSGEERRPRKSRR